MLGDFILEGSVREILCVLHASDAFKYVSDFSPGQGLGNGVTAMWRRHLLLQCCSSRLVQNTPDLVEVADHAGVYRSRARL